MSTAKAVSTARRKHASFFIVMAVTQAEARTYEDVAVHRQPTPRASDRARHRWSQSTQYASHGYIRHDPSGAGRYHVLSRRGQAFAIAQTVQARPVTAPHDADVALARRAFDMMRRAL